MRPLLPGAAQARVVYASKELSDEINAGSQEPYDPFAYRIGALLADFDQFSSGELITVGYRKEKTCFIKPLEPTNEEVWEMRSRDPKPSLRVFGRFAECDVFIATHMARRDRLGGWGSLEWSSEIRRCKTIWRRLLDPYQPHSGASIYDYISENVVEVGNLS